jgi:uncharacterized protein (DUF1330 family)
MPIEPTPDDLRRLGASEDKGPFVLAQLLRFAEGGRDTYLAYSRDASRILRDRGAQIVYAGECIEPLTASEGQTWDALVLIRYPSRAAYVEMMSDAEFQRVSDTG